jgi:capsule polysaccharide export protein KpsE/RkpR
MTQTSAKRQREVGPELPELQEKLVPVEEDPREARERSILKLRLVWAERRFLFRAGVAGLLASTLLAFLLPKRFVSTAQLMPPDSQTSSTLALVAGLVGQGGGGGGGMGAGAVAGDLLGLKTTGALFVGVLNSRTVEDRIIDRFDLRKVYGVKLLQSAREHLAGNTSISEERKSGIISLSVSDRDPRRAAAIAAAYVDELNTMMAQLTTSSAHRERVFLEERLKTVNSDLESAEKDFSQFASKNATIDITEQAKAMVVSAATLQGQLVAAQSQLEGLKQIYTDSNIRVRSIQARVNELHHQLELLGGKYGAPASGNDSASESLYPTLRQLPILGVPYADLFRQLKIEQIVYETLTKEYELAKVQEAKEIPTVKVLDSPLVPERKSYPPRLMIILLGTIITVVICTVWLIVAARWRETDPGDPGKLFAQEIFQTVAARWPWASSNGSYSGNLEESHQDSNSENGEARP